MYRKHLKIAVVLLALFGTLFSTGQAAAAPAHSDGTHGTAGVITRMTAVPANGRVSCFGYYGTFKAGTYVMVVDWATASDECFGIATDRTIWHAWPTAGGWKPMPGGGHADFINGEIVENLSTGARGISVFATTNGTYWCQDYYRSTDWTGDWYLC